MNDSLSSTSNELMKPLHELLLAAQELIRFAHNEEWEALDMAATNYQQHVRFLDDNIYLNALNEANLAEDAKVLITQILGLNEELDLYANTQREKIASELRLINQSGKALDAYGQ